ncbi:MAG: DNA recombination protein RmuC [Puniceicoccales bacterium]|jgi:DNA recombination protein RmuC|nr:DNA recombination protein RmuC [Puniceicoccales bacterium]
MMGPFLVGLLVGFVIFRMGWASTLKQGRDYGRLREKYVELETLRRTEREFYQEKQSAWDQMEKKLEENFRSISLEMFRQNARSFLGLAEESLKTYEAHTQTNLEAQKMVWDKTISPLKESLSTFQQRIQEFEKARHHGEASWQKQLQHLGEMQLRLETKTQELARSLRDPNTRGRWGELQLKRVVEYAGMLEHVDFETQPSIEAEDQTLRPDMIVHLPNQRTVVVDAKSPLFEEWLEAESVDSDGSPAWVQRIRETIGRLGAKSYELPNAPDFVVLFFPAESLLGSVLRKDPSLLEYAGKHNVVLATPTTLIALLKAVSYGWKQVDMAREAKEICRLGGETYQRMLVFFHQFQDLRRHLEKTVDTYNRMVGSLESRLLPSAERLQTFSRKNTPVPQPEAISVPLRRSTQRTIPLGSDISDFP